MVELGKPCQVLAIGRHTALLSRSGQVFHDRVRIRNVSAPSCRICDAGKNRRRVPHVQKGKRRLRIAKKLVAPACTAGCRPVSFRLAKGLLGVRNKVAELKDYPQNIAAVFEASQPMAQGALRRVNDLAPFLPSAVQGLLCPQVRNERREHRRRIALSPCQASIPPEICTLLDYMRAENPEPESTPKPHVAEEIGCVGHELRAGNPRRRIQVRIGVVAAKLAKRFEGLAGGTLQRTPRMGTPGEHFLPNTGDPRVRSLRKPVGKLNEALSYLAQLVKLSSSQVRKAPLGLAQWPCHQAASWHPGPANTRQLPSQNRRPPANYQVQARPSRVNGCGIAPKENTAYPTLRRSKEAPLLRRSGRLAMKDSRCHATPLARSLAPSPDKAFQERNKLWSLPRVSRAVAGARLPAGSVTISVPAP